MLHQTGSFVRAFTSSAAGPNPPFDPVAVTSEPFTHARSCAKPQSSRSRPVVLMLSGFAGFGKDECGKHLASSFGFTREAFADRLKDEVASTYPGLNREAMDTSDGKASSVLVDASIGTETLRSLLIRHGAWRRSQDANYWADLVVSRISTAHTRLKHELRVVITDWRYPNEYERVRTWAHASGVCVVCWRIRRGSLPSPVDDSSEHQLDDFAGFLYTLENEVRFDPHPTDPVRHSLWTAQKESSVSDAKNTGHYYGNSLYSYRYNIDCAVATCFPWMTFAVVDVDDVVLAWIDAFRLWLLDHPDGYKTTSDYPTSWGMQSWIARSAAPAAATLTAATPTPTPNAMQLINEFNSCDFFSTIPPVHGAVEGLAALRDAGYTVVLVSSCLPKADGAFGMAALRLSALIALVGEQGFSSLCMLPLGASKMSAIRCFKRGIMIDDNHHHLNATASSEDHLSILLYLMEAPWNRPSVFPPPNVNDATETTKTQNDNDSNDSTNKTRAEQSNCKGKRAVAAESKPQDVSDNKKYDRFVRVSGWSQLCALLPSSPLMPPY